MQVTIDIDPRDFLSADDIAKQAMNDALDMLVSGRADVAASILCEATNREERGTSDPEADRQAAMTKVFEEWQKAGSPDAFWEWSHGRRKMS